ncbi:MAG: MFS transporter [Candidatus Micrarchaeaceae archaeon]
MLTGDFVTEFKEVDRSFKFFIYSRAARSVGLIYVSLAFSLYLSALKLSLVSIGFVAALVMLFMIFFTLILGFLGDRAGFKVELLISEGVTFLGIALITISTNIDVIIIGMMIAGLTGGAGGIRGSFSPGSNAFIANNYRDEKERVKKYSLNSLVASVSAIAGSILFSLVTPLSLRVGLLLAYRYLFAISAALLGVSFIMLLFLKEQKKEKKTAKIMNKTSQKYIVKVITVNSLGGAGMGLIAPLLPLWLVLMYHVTSLEVGTLFTVVYAATALGLYFSLKYANKFESLAIAYVTRVVQGALIIAMALSPTFLVAGVFYFLRATISGFGSPSRTNVNIRGISNEDYGTASSVQGVATRVAQLSSGASGYLMDILLPIPLLAGGMLQMASGISYKLLFKRKDKQTHIARQRGKSNAKQRFKYLK